MRRVGDRASPTSPPSTASGASRSSSSWATTAGSSCTSGGFYSLDTFFALSGFLITSLLHLRMAAYDHDSPRAFLGSTRPPTPSGPSWSCCSGWPSSPRSSCPAGTYPTLRGDAFSALFYFANWHFIANGSNYFDQTALTSPLTHTWSLAVEEQFYLVWPLVVLGVFKLWKSTSGPSRGVRRRGASPRRSRWACSIRPATSIACTTAPTPGPNPCSSARRWRCASPCGRTVGAASGAVRGRARSVPTPARRRSGVGRADEQVDGPRRSRSG